MRSHRKIFGYGFTILVILAILGITVPVMATETTSTPAGWYNCAWNNRQSIIIDRSKVAGYLSNFPVLISLATDTDLASSARADGYDILFTSSDGTTRLSHEIESYKSSTGALVAWVKVPSLSSGSNTVLYMYYGNPGAANQQNGANVWSNGYRDVWHLDEGGTGARADSTGSGNNLNTRNYKGNEGATGQIGGADSLDGTNKYLESANNIGITGSAPRTITFWARLTNTNRCGLVGWGTNAYHSEFEAAVRNNKYFLWGYGAGNDWENIASPLTGSWNHYAITYDGATARWYMNGAQIGSGFAHDYNTAESHVFVGYEYDSGQSSITYMHGMIDEVHVLSTSRNSRWIQTEFNNQNSPSTFSSLQAVEKVSDCSMCRIPTPPVADLTADVTSGKAPLTVAFTDRSTNTPTAWSWEFGDGATSSLQNPVNTYTAPGTYTVKLSVANEDGSDTLVKQDYVTVNPATPPVANLVADVTSGKAPLTVAFTDRSTNSPTAWTWEFGDGATSSLQNPVNTYTVPGTYTVKLSVSNGDGSDTIVKQDYITVSFDCGDSYRLVTPDGETAGCVAVTNEWTEEEATNSLLNTIYVAYTMADSYCLKSADVAIAFDTASVAPQYSETFDASACTGSYTFRIQLPDYAGDVSYLYVTAHGVVQEVTPGASADMDAVVPENPIYYIIQG